VRSFPALLAAALLTVACSSSKPSPEPSPRQAGRARESAVSREGALERRVAELEQQVAERDAQVKDLQTRLDDTRAEVVRTMAKLQTVASRAEAASGMAEAELALQSLKASAAQAPEVAQVTSLVRQSTAEFNKQNYGGALYLAGQAKAMADISRAAVPARRARAKKLPPCRKS
jgi:uncharacterized coiled-coil protein SlyX